MEFSKRIKRMAAKIVAEGYKPFTAYGLEANRKPILVVIFADIGATPRYVNSFDCSGWQTVSTKTVKAKPSDIIHKPSDTVIANSGQPGSLERIAALAAYYANVNGMAIERGNGLDAITFQNEVSPFAITDDEIANQLASLALRRSRRQTDFTMPICDLPIGSTDAIGFSKHHKVSGELPE
jgi:hypothetical protein